MESLQLVKSGVVIRPQVADNATVTSYVIDTAGVDYVNIDVILGETDAAMTVLKIQESDTYSTTTALGGTPADVTGLVYGTSSNPDTGVTSALPTDAVDGTIYSFSINTQARKRYLALIAVAGNGTTGTAISAIYKANKLSNQGLTASNRGLAAQLKA